MISLIAMKELVSSAARIFALVGLIGLLAGCMSEALERQAEQIRQQSEEIARQRKELEALAGGKQVQDQKQQDCNRAFREYFDKAQLSTNRDEVISLYRQGLGLCPDDDVAHYELGRALVDAGRRPEAEKEFDAALKINPGFAEARRQLDALRNNR
jgi:tetratricopeptide (TPR) repeat protein